MVQDFNKMKAREVFPGFHGSFVHGKQMTFAHWEIKKGSASPEHSHVHEQGVYVIEGDLELTIDGHAQTLSPGMTVIIPSNVKHAARAITHCKVLDTFCPVREDYK